MPFTGNPNQHNCPGRYVCDGAYVSDCRAYTVRDDYKGWTNHSKGVELRAIGGKWSNSGNVFCARCVGMTPREVFEADWVDARQMQTTETSTSPHGDQTGDAAPTVTPSPTTAAPTPTTAAPTVTPRRPPPPPPPTAPGGPEDHHNGPDGDADHCSPNGDADHGGPDADHCSPDGDTQSAASSASRDQIRSLGDRIKQLEDQLHQHHWIYEWVEQQWIEQQWIQQQQWIEQQWIRQQQQQQWIPMTKNL